MWDVWIFPFNIENFPSSCKLGVTPSELVSVLENAVRETVIWNKQLKFQTNGCEVVRNGTYRSLETRQELDDDIPTCLLSEEPLVSTPIADCSGCQSSTLEFEEVGGPLLVEHVILALAITSADSAVTNLVLSELSTGLVSDDSRGQRCWSLRFLMVASAVSSIAALIRTLNIWHGSDGNDDACNGGYQATLAWAEKLFLVLVRIPTNTHAVSQLSRESPYCEEACVGRVSTVSQRRMGYAIFVGASAVNHSCDPNAAFRYCFKQVEAHETSPLQLLREGLRIELRCISKEPLLAGQELCVSYGPLKGRMTLAQRRNALSSQYLFLCRCASCVAEQEEEEERGRRSGGEQARQREQVQWKILRDLQNKVSVLSDEYLQLQLHPEAFSLFEQRLHLLVRMTLKDILYSYYYTLTTILLLLFQIIIHSLRSNESPRSQQVSVAPTSAIALMSHRWSSAMRRTSRIRSYGRGYESCRRSREGIHLWRQGAPSCNVHPTQQ